MTGSRTNWEVRVAELAAARWGMIVARRLGYCHIVIESDALEIVRLGEQ